MLYICDVNGVNMHIKHSPRSLKFTLTLTASNLKGTKLSEWGFSFNKKKAQPDNSTKI